MTALLVAYLASLVSYASSLTAELAAYVVQALPAIDFGDTVSWAALAGVFTPLLTSVVQQPTWSKPKRTFFGVLVSVVIGVLTCLADGTLSDASTVLAAVAVVAVASATTYKGIWKPSGIATGLEQATSSGTRHAA